MVDFSLPRHVSQRHRMHDYTMILKIFTLGSIYSTNASGAEQTPETNNSNRIIQDIAFLGKQGFRYLNLTGITNLNMKEKSK